MLQLLKRGIPTVWRRTPMLPDQYRVDVLPLFSVDGDFSWDRLDPEVVRAWMNSGAFLSLRETFSKYPEHSLLSSGGRAFLYQLIRCNRPANVVEIGTYWAGTAEVMARALEANNFGHLYTCDPYGEGRCPAIIRQWPEALRNRTTFLPINSMGLVDYLKMREIRADIVFVDGCHDFEYALFDACAMSRVIRPGGVMIMDNAEQPGVVSAAKEYLRLNPDWRALGSSAGTLEYSEPFAHTLDRSSIPETTFIVLEAPRHASVPAHTYVTTGQVRYARKDIGGVRAEMLPGQSGMLHVEVCLRGFGEGVPVEVKRHDAHRLISSKIAQKVDLRCDLNLDSSPDNRTPASKRCTCEITLFWDPDDKVSTLRLTELPVPVSG